MVSATNVLTAAALLLASSAEGLGTNYEHDGKTTYCWAIPRRTSETKLTEADRTTAYSTRAECPMAMTLTLPGTSFTAFDPVNITWSVQVDFSGPVNAINNTRLYFGPDSTGRAAQIVHSNVHSCVFGTGCDPFSDGEQLVDKTVNKVANFTDNKATFDDTLQFPTPGEYSVLAHIILPNFNSSSRFDYAVYTKVTVRGASAATASPTADVETSAPSTADTTSESSSGLSSGATIGIVIGAVVVVVVLAVVVVMMRRRKGNQSTGYTQAPIHDGTGTSGGGGGGLKHSDVTNTNSTSGFQSAWGGQGDQRPTHVGLDNTGYSNASSNHSAQYAAPSVSDVRPSDMNQFSSSMHQPDMSASAYFGNSQPAPGGRKKRVDSDVEL